MGSDQTNRSTGIILTVVIVNYRSWADVVRLVQILAGSPSIASGASEIVVVDNASGDLVPLQFETPRSGVRCIMMAENGGFSAGVNAGWRSSSAAWILVMNPDVVAREDFLDRVLERISRNETRPGGPPGVVGFGLRNPDGSRQPSVGSFPGLFRTVWEQLIPRSRRKYQPEWRLRTGPVDWVTGACLLLDARMLHELGGMDEDFFLYYEEVALCRLANRRGWGVEFDPEISVVHLRPLQNRPISPKMRVITRHSKLLYFRKYLPHWQFASLGAMVRLEARVREILCRARGRSREARAWQAVGRVATLLVAGADLKGRTVKLMAEAVDDPPEEAEDPEVSPVIPPVRDTSRQTHRSPHGTRPIQPRKDGT